MLTRFVTYHYFLGLKNLTIIDNCVRNIQITCPDFDIEKVDENDELTFKLFGKGKTNGIFQFESDGMKRVIKELRPQSIEDLTAVTSLYRPGPSQSIPEYIKNKHNPGEIKYATELLRPILEVTYGCLVYQEQVMQVFRTLAGYSFARADIVRRAMSKKKHDVLQKERETFISGCLEKGISTAVASDLFEKISAFSSYAFNKAHAVCYATVAYRNGYLKAHFPKEYMAALMTSVLDTPAKIQMYISECSSMGIDVFAPDINRGRYNFSADDGGINFGLAAIKNISASVIDTAVQLRERDGNFLSLVDFCERMRGKGINRKTVECLIKSGCFDKLGATRKEMISSLDKILAELSENGRREISGQIGFFDLAEIEAPKIVIEKLGEYDKAELAQMEREALGFCVTNNPLLELREVAKRYGCLTAEKIAECSDGDEIKLIGIVESIKKKQTKKGEMMEFVSVETFGGNINLIIFPKVLNFIFNKVNVGQALLIFGKASVKDDDTVEVVVNDAKTMTANNSKSIYIKLKSKTDENLEKVIKLIHSSIGENDVYFCFADAKSTLKYKKAQVKLNEDFTKQLTDILGDQSFIIK